LVLVGIGVLLLYQIRVIFPPLVLALAIIYLLNPMVSRLNRRGIPRWLGTLAIYAVFVLVVFLLVSILLPTMRRQAAELGDRLPELQREGTRAVERVAEILRRPDIKEDIGKIADSIQSQIITGGSQLLRLGRGAIHLLLIFVLAPWLALYLLIDLPRLSKSFAEYLPPRYRGEWLMLLRKCGESVGGFFRGQLLVAAAVGILSSALLALIGIPFWLPIGMLIGFFNIIPFVGPFLGGAFAVVVAAVDGGVSRALLAAGAMLLVQQIDNHFISPKIMGATLKLHPVTVILALLAGGTLAGLWGMLIAVPATSVVKVLFMHYYSTHVLGSTLEVATREAAVAGASSGSGSIIEASTVSGAHESAARASSLTLADESPTAQESPAPGTPAATESPIDQSEEERMTQIQQ
jgi:predicted PurR-regulated permease PerM